MSQDSHLQQAVLDEFAWEPSVTAGHIGVAVSAGVVTLTGTVESYAQKLAAETAARRVKGVQAVAEEIQVQLPFARQRDDSQIAAAILDRLSWDVSVPQDSVKVTVERGWVTLTGELDHYYQREAAAHDVHGLHGIRGVSNNTTIKPVVNTGELSDDITHALHRSWFFNPDNIQVTATAGKVRLTGTVQSPHERQVAAATAWSASGVVAVDNAITVV